MTYKNLLDILTEGRTLPEGTDMWAIKTTHPDLRTSYDYRWPYPGNWATAPGPIDRGNTWPTPSWKGDGICVATTWKGMASGNIPASTLLLCAIDTSDILGRREGSGKLRVSRAYVVDLIDGARLIREHGQGANLRGIILYGADLRCVDLRYADLQSANLQSADLRCANLRYADLQSANLRYAYLQGADLHGADLRGASLCYANLHGANLQSADLRDAELTPEQRAYAKKQGAIL